MSTHTIKSLAMADNRSLWFETILDKRDLPILYSHQIYTPDSKIDAKRQRIVNKLEADQKAQIAETKKKAFINGLLGI